MLSLFDGISVAQLALKELNIPVNYYASEIDKNCIKLTQHHFPNTIQLGNVCDIDGTTLPNIDLMVFGSPCQSLSSLNRASRTTGLDSEDSGLFYEALRILKEVEPKFYIMENVKSMPTKDRNIISDLLGVKPIEINSNLVSCSNRSRLYWTNIPNVVAPEDKNISLQDYIEDGFFDRKFSNAILTKNIPYTKAGLIRYLKRSIGQVVFHDKSFAELPKKEKLKRIYPMPLEEVKSLYRLFTVQELEQCQTLPIGYVSDILKKTPATHAIGNSFTKDVISHILSFANF
ncbi:DNA cytosine methyltransferase [uncultured Algibacter sp.]|uniref:DNA cytosine methyltransferase n=1 Tax=uncultured Algibacter sp. TaxID=298659 RepID=UPI00261D24A8|nr:DNA cytosine methyltransferase [uncultured Algibacter sp.]